MPHYREALDLTLSTIVARARNHRNQVVAVAVLGTVSVVGALALGRAWPLVGLALLPPTVGLFLWNDGRQLQRWLTEVLARWCRGQIEIGALAQALRANRTLPGTTLEAMLATLHPALPDTPTDLAQRGAVSETLLLRARRAQRALGVRVVVLSLVAAAALVMTASALRGAGP